MKKMGAMRKNAKEAGNCKKCYYFKQRKTENTDEDLTVTDCQYLHKPTNEAILQCKGNWIVEY